METLKLKKKLIDEVNLLNNKDLIEELYSFLKLENNVEKIYVLNEQQKDAIKDARQQIIKGDYLTNNDANAKIEKWLNK